MQPQGIIGQRANVMVSKQIIIVLVLLLIPVILSNVYAIPCTMYIVEVPDKDSSLVELGYVVDGDTIRLKNGTYVRLVGYDAYEANTELGQEAKSQLEQLCKTPIFLDRDDLEPYDKYGRVLGYLWCPNMSIYFSDGELSHNINVNKWFLTEGKKYVYRTLYIPPDEHPYWTWLTRHTVYLPPYTSVHFYNMTKKEFYSSREVVSLLSGRYIARIECATCNLSYTNYTILDLISDVSREVRISTNFYFMVVRGMDNRIYYTFCNMSKCAGYPLGPVWGMLPGSTVDALTVTRGLNSSLLLLALRGRDSGIYMGYMDGVAGTFSGWIKLPGSTLSKPVVAVDRLNNKIFAVVRGANNKIYYAVYDQSKGNWSGWKSLPGSTVDAPAVAVAGGKLHIVVRGSDGRSIWYGQLDARTESFSGWTRLPGSTPSAPSLSSSEDGSYMVLSVRGMDNRIYLKLWSEGKWSDWVRIPTGSTSQPPGVLVGSSPLHVHVSVVGMDNRSIYYTALEVNWSTLSVESLCTWTKLPGSTPSTPALSLEPVP